MSNNAAKLFPKQTPPKPEVLLEVYALYVEMADRVSARRQTYNSFSITLNTLLGSGLGLALGANLHHEQSTFSWILIAIGGLGLIINLLWYRLIESYRQLNSAKFQIIHQIEDVLGINPYAAEWSLMGHGKNPALYRPLTHLERWLPLGLAFLSLTLLAVGLFFLIHKYIISN